MSFGGCGGGGVDGKKRRRKHAHLFFNLPSFLSTHYLRFLLPLEQEMRTAGTYVPGKAPPPDEDAGRGGRSALAGRDPGVFA